MKGRKTTPPIFWLGVGVARVVLASCADLGTKGHPPMAYALNLSSAPVSLALVKDDKVLVAFDDLAPQESHKLVRLPVVAGAVLRQGAEPQSVDDEWTDPSGTAYSLEFRPGNLYAVVVSPEGRAAVYSLPETYSMNPKVCIVNVSSETLSQVQIAPAWAKNVKVYTQDVVPGLPSEFYSLEPKTLGLFWQTPSQVLLGGHTAPEEPKWTFEPGKYYLFLAGGGAVHDLTPDIE